MCTSRLKRVVAVDTHCDKSLWHTKSLSPLQVDYKVTRSQVASTIFNSFFFIISIVTQRVANGPSEMKRCEIISCWLITWLCLFVFYIRFIGAFKKLKSESSLIGGSGCVGSSHIHNPSAASCPTPARRRHRTTFTQVSKCLNWN